MCHRQRYNSQAEGPSDAIDLIYSGMATMRLGIKTAQ